MKELQAKKLSEIIDVEWVKTYPDTMIDLLRIFEDDRARTKDYINSIENKLERAKELNMMSSAIIEDLKKYKDMIEWYDGHVNEEDFRDPETAVYIRYIFGLISSGKNE